MIYKNTAILSLGIASFLFAGCATEEAITPGQQATTTKTGIDITSEAQMNAGITIGDTQAAENARKGLEAIATQQNDSRLPPQIAVEDPFQTLTEGLGAADQAAFEGALKLNDPSYCEKLSTDENKVQCRNALQNKALLNEALATLDPASCDKISTQDLRDACKIQIEVEQKFIAQSQEKQNLFQSEYQIRDQAYTKLDLSMCNQITTSGIKIECRVNVITEKARQEENPALCEELDSEYQDSCKNAVSR